MRLRREENAGTIAGVSWEWIWSGGFEGGRRRGKGRIVKGNQCRVLESGVELRRVGSCSLFIHIGVGQLSGMIHLDADSGSKLPSPRHLDALG